MYFRSLPKIYKTSNNNNNKVTIRLTNSKRSMASDSNNTSSGNATDPVEYEKKSRSSPLVRTIARLIVRFRVLPRIQQFVVAGISAFIIGISIGYIISQFKSYSKKHSSSSFSTTSNYSHGQHGIKKRYHSAPRIIQIIEFDDDVEVEEVEQQQHRHHQSQQRERKVLKSTKLTRALSNSNQMQLPPEGDRVLIEKYIPISNRYEVKKLYPIDPPDKDPCYHMHDWQLEHRPTCNSIHEASSAFQQPFFYVPDDDQISDEEHAYTIENLRLVAGGAFRHVWMIREYNGAKLALKTLRVDRKGANFDLRSWDRHRRDAISMDMLTKSPLIVDIFSYCTNTGIFHWGEGGDLSNIFARSPDISSEELLHIAYNVSMSVGDAHNYDRQGRPTIAHTDIKVDQFLYQDGFYKLTDFNRVRFLTWNNQENKQCGFTVPKNGGVWRSPEEYSHQRETEKVDVFSLGNVLYYLLTRQYPWRGVKSDDVYAAVMDGDRPPIPRKILESTDPFHKYMIQGIHLAHEHDPKKRASAYDVAQKLAEGFDEF